MLFTQFNMEDALRVNYEEGFEDGEEEGEKKGKVLQLIQQVSCKLQKGKTIAVIAEELEEESEAIRQICSVIEQCGINADIEKIYSVLENKPKE